MENSILFSDFLSLMEKVEQGYKVETCHALTPDNAFPTPCHRFFTGERHVVVYRPKHLDGGES